MSEKILITGATGTIGKAVVKHLKAKNASFLIASRNPEEAAEKFGSDINVVKFEFEDISTFENAVDGVSKVFLLGPPLRYDLADVLMPFLDFLKAKNILEVVYISALGAEKMGDTLTFHTIIEEKLKADGFDYTILKPSFFSQNFKNYEWENITQRGITYVTAGEGKVGFIDVDDIGLVASTVLTSTGHSKKIYELTGPELLSYQDAATLLSEVTGKQIVYPNPSIEEYTKALKAAGAPDFIAPYMTSVYSLISDHKVNFLTNNVETITGKKPSLLRDVLIADFK
ncbi:hypothetical protein A5893_09500 [Pedobacter psychrophilus]|uniref:NmrA-like domain-containing protein n=1 Tax=Pedobacter psychrophilus TaxID=1826909 RepID=A0A179DFK6_9SPHI|nr:SDR family oxidoreductase [Pedobacter psychrophilus]OAQ39801.1 hypothetical protein A5893_09500 [Pedobacter psychrophilus]